MNKFLLYLLSYFFCTCVFAKQAFDFNKQCQQPHLSIVAVGDVLLHQALQQKAQRHSFVSLWEKAIPFIKTADMAYANIEGPMASGVNKRGRVIVDAGPDNQSVYSSYPLFNYPPSLAKAMVDSGFDIVSTANNHSLDRFSIGVDKTIDSLQAADLAFTGTRKVAAPKKFFTILEQKGYRIAWLACTQDTNGIKDKHQQVLLCYKRNDRRYIVKTIQQLKHQVDAIIVTPHWGQQYSHQPNRAQTRFAKQMLDAGATAIIGSHPHVVQPIKSYRTADGRHTLIAYSLGNFVSFQGTPKNRSTILLNLGLNKTKRGGVEICSVNYQPAYMVNRRGLKSLHLSLLSNKDKNHIAYKILRRVLPQDNFI